MNFEPHMDLGLRWSWLKSLGLRSPGLKLGVEKSRVGMTCNTIYSRWTFNGCDQSNLCTVKNYWSFWINMSYRRRYTEAFKPKNHPEANYWSVAFSINPCNFLLNLKYFVKETYPFCFLLIVSRKPTLSVAVIMLLMHRWTIVNFEECSHCTFLLVKTTKIPN